MYLASNVTTSPGRGRSATMFLASNVTTSTGRGRSATMFPASSARMYLASSAATFLIRNAPMSRDSSARAFPGRFARPPNPLTEDGDEQHSDVVVVFTSSPESVCGIIPRVFIYLLLFMVTDRPIGKSPSFYRAQTRFKMK